MGAVRLAGWRALRDGIAPHFDTGVAALVTDEYRIGINEDTPDSHSHYSKICAHMRKNITQRWSKKRVLKLVHRRGQQT